ncbi:NEQ484 [Nanoarchaeum equitans Kin4-M]|uniref:NEQ484 n=1 Tax=Nanoarchaeum equitans (strain Kin4-M) TaxID=228908 RepID=Q74MC0_NANEQ|nr:NEQ484 [Nanoarchaeum equitans Kin4-M]
MKLTKEIYEKYLKNWEIAVRYLDADEIELAKEDEKILVLTLARRANSKIDIIIDEIETILLPSEEISVIHELRAFSNKDIEWLLELYRLASYYSRAIKYGLYFKDIDYLKQTINELLEFYKEKEPQLRELFARKRDIWKEPINKSQYDFRYFL